MRKVALTVLVVGLLAAPAVSAGGPVCNFTTVQAFKACDNEAWEEYYLTRAACKNITERGERILCSRQAVRDVNEALEECDEQAEARSDLCDELPFDRYDPDFDPENFEDLESKGGATNPYWSLEPGRTSVIRVGESAEESDELVITYVTDEVVEIDGVPCRVVVDAEFEIETGDEEDEDGDKGVDDEIEYEATEITDDWYAQHVNGDIWYCGELSRNFEDGRISDLDGSFTAGEDGAQAGVLIRAAPIVGEIYRQEFALQEAEDVGEVLSTNADAPLAKGNDFDCDGMCLQTRDFSPLEPEVEEHKYYIPGVGFILAVEFEDGEMSDEREVLVCAGDSLEILADPECGIEDPEALLDALCELSPDVFCDDEEEEEQPAR